MKIKKLLAAILLACLAFTFTGCEFIYTAFPDIFGTQVPPENDNSTGDITSINVIMINDNHGIFNEEDGGIDKIDAGIDYYASLGDVVKIANGDMFQGTYVSSTLRGLPMLDALNAMDFDAFVIGNHEFDWGFDEMKKYKDGDLTNGEANFPFLGANIYEKSTNQMVDWLEPYAVVEFDDIKIGIIGIIGDVETSILSSHVEEYDFVDARNIVKELAAELRTAKECDVVIVAVHGDDDELNATLATYEGDSRIDGIFTGHSHIPTDEEIRRADGTDICVLQNGGYGDSFATLKLKFDANGQLKDTDGRLHDTNRFSSNGSLAEVFAKYEDYMAIGDTVLYTSDSEYSRYDVGMAVTLSMVEKYNADFSIINTGGVRAEIDAGEVTYADIFQVLPFENEVYIVTMSGKDIITYLSTAKVYYWGLNSIDDNQDYQVAIVDYVYLGYTFEDYRRDDYIDTNDLIRDVFLEWIKSNE